MTRRPAVPAQRAALDDDLLGCMVVLRLSDGTLWPLWDELASESEAAWYATAAARHLPVEALVVELRVVRRVTG